MSDSEIPDLVGKIIAVKYGNRQFAYIQEVSFELQAGRRFLVGKTIVTPYDSASGIRFCIAWDVLMSYYEFDSLEECHKAMAVWYPPEKKSRFWFLRK
jgi:hypothetical protein